jgi:hypothetical protein
MFTSPLKLKFKVRLKIIYFIRFKDLVKVDRD